MFCVFCSSLSVLFFVLAFLSDTGISVFYAALASVFVFLNIVLLIAGKYIRYVLEDDGIRLPGSSVIIGFDIQEFIPYDKITEIRETQSMAFSPALSSDGVMIIYKNDNNRSDSVILSPEDKGEFLAKLNERYQDGRQTEICRYIPIRKEYEKI